jgi:hypothetical protein
MEVKQAKEVYQKIMIARDREGHTTYAVLENTNTKERSKVILLCSDRNRIY